MNSPLISLPAEVSLTETCTASALPLPEKPFCFTTASSQQLERSPRLENAAGCLQQRTSRSLPRKASVPASTQGLRPTTPEVSLSRAKCGIPMSGTVTSVSGPPGTYACMPTRHQVQLPAAEGGRTSMIPGHKTQKLAYGLLAMVNKQYQAQNPSPNPRLMSFVHVQLLPNNNRARRSHVTMRSCKNGQLIARHLQLRKCEDGPAPTPAAGRTALPQRVAVATSCGPRTHCGCRSHRLLLCPATMCYCRHR